MVVFTHCFRAIAQPTLWEVARRHKIVPINRFQFQRGQQPTDFKPMQTIGKGVEEIRIWTGEAYRIFYVSRFEEAVYVLCAFQKTTQKTSQRDIELGKKRYLAMVQFRQTQKEEENG